MWQQSEFRENWSDIEQQAVREFHEWETSDKSRHADALRQGKTTQETASGKVSHVCFTHSVIIIFKNENATNLKSKTFSE